ncbi:MAG: nitroreductase family deazaflavin-dependent oxidoreductase [Solirubrobacteraceae bacterium]
MLRLALRAPLLLYRVRLGWLLGERFLLLVHQGHNTGLHRETLLEVVYRDKLTGEVVVVAAWGESAAWYRNLRAAPAIEVRIGHERWPAPNHRFLNEHELSTVLQHYQGAHPLATRALARTLGWQLNAPAPERERSLATIRAVAFSPSPWSPTPIAPIK